MIINREPRSEEMQLLAELCFEQGMKNHEVIHEMREFHYESLRDTVQHLKAIVTRSQHPACVAARESVLSIGQWRPSLVTQTESGAS